VAVVDAVACPEEASKVEVAVVALEAGEEEA